MDKNLTRRDLLKTTGASLAMLGMPNALAGAQAAPQAPSSGATCAGADTRATNAVVARREVRHVHSLWCV